MSARGYDPRNPAASARGPRGRRGSFDWRAAVPLAGIFVAAVAIFALGYASASLSWMGYVLAGVGCLIGLVTFGIGVWQGWKIAKYERDSERVPTRAGADPDA